MAYDKVPPSLNFPKINKAQMDALLERSYNARAASQKAVERSKRARENLSAVPKRSVLKLDPDAGDV